MSTTPWTPSHDNTPWDRIGGEEAVRQLVERFYDHMSEHEPDLAQMHICDEDGRVAFEPREKFRLFLNFWLGGPRDYLEQRGHPQLKRRHAPFPVDKAMRDAWMRSMCAAMDAQGLDPELKGFLEGRFAGVAEFMRNVPED